MKITKYILSLAAAVGMIAGCQKAELVQMLPAEDIVAPVLADLPESIVITPKNMAIDTVEFIWTKADFGAPTQVTYAIEVSEANGDKKAVISSGITDTTAVILYEAINVALYEGLELPDGVASAVNFFVSAYTGESAKVYSAPVAVTVTPTAAEKTYPMIYMPGSYQDWKPDQAPAKFQVLYDFTGTGVFEGIADFITSPDESRAWKFTPEPDWDFDWGIPKDATPEAEAAEVTLINNDGGERSDIKIYTAKRFYHFTMNTNTGLLKHNYSFDQVGVVGELTGWADGADKVMEFNAAKRRFYVDVEGLKGMFKFRLDGKWDKNWGASDFGVEVSNGDGNLEAEEGNYRVYLYLSNSGALAYELSASMYGKEEPVGGNVVEPETPVEPEKPAELVGWGLVGEFSGWADGADKMLTSDGTYLVAKGVALSGQFKFRKDGKWETNFGATGDVEPFELTANAETELVANGKNFTIAEGTYDVYLDDVNAKAWFINDGSYPGGAVAPEASEWGVVGQVNGWNAPDITMYKTATEGLFVAYKVEMPAGGFKIRANGEWNDAANYGLEGGKANVEVDHAYDVITSGGSGDMILVAGTYDIWFDLNNTKVYIMTPGKPISEAEGGVAEVPDMTTKTWYLVGNFNGWNVCDPNYAMTAEGDFFVFKGMEVAAEYTHDGNTGMCEMKFAPGEWNGDKGGVFAVDAACATGSDNIKVPAGTYDIYLSKDFSTFYFMTEGKTPADVGAAPETPEVTEKTWHIVGNFNGWNPGDPNYAMTAEGDFFVFKEMDVAAEYTHDGNTGPCEMKFAPGEWNNDKGGEEGATFEVNVGKTIAGSNIAVPAGKYDIYLKKDLTKYYFMTPGEVPAE